MLPKEAILEYQALYKKVYGKSISFDEATIKANDFMAFFKVAYKPIKKSWLKNNAKYRTK